jgi:hypothetical protein
LAAWQQAFGSFEMDRPDDSGDMSVQTPDTVRATRKLEFGIWNLEFGSWNSNFFPEEPGNPRHHPVIPSSSLLDKANSFLEFP